MILMYGIQSSRFWWLYFFDWTEWKLLVDIPTQILLIIVLFIDHFSRCKLKAYMITHTKKMHLRQIDIFRKSGKAMEVKIVSKFGIIYMYYKYSFTPIPTKWLSWALWKLLLLMKPSDAF